MSARLQHSFAAVYSLLERPRAARRVVAVLLVIHTLLLCYSAYVHSPTLNEPAHLVAGLSHWKFGRFDSYNVNTPLVRMVAALPVMVAGYNEDWKWFDIGAGARPEIAMGENFVAANGDRSFFLFMIARWACIPFSCIGAIVCYLWARDLYGRPSGVLACAIWCFEPNILAHASLITADAGATALGLAACYMFWRWLKRPTWTQAAINGVVLGIAESAKTTLIVFYPLWPLMWIIYRCPERKNMFARDWLREGGMLALRMVIGLYVLNLVYSFEGSFTRLKDFQFVSELFTSSPSIGSGSLESQDPRSGLTNRFAGTWIGELPVPFPRNYVLGIDMQQRDFEHYPERSYLCGKWQDHGWWYYYVYACALKVPLGLWALGAIALFAFLFFRTTRETFSRAAPTTQIEQSKGPWRDHFSLLFPATAIFVTVSSKTGFSEHMRYVLPSFPFFFIAISQVLAVRSLTYSRQGVYCALLKSGGRRRQVPFFSTALVSMLSCWFLSSSLSNYPHSLSYFNESIGGPLNGANYLLGSNIDWGQDLRYARWWTEVRPIDPLHLVYFGYFDPTDIGINFTIPPDVPTAATLRTLERGPYLISVNCLSGYPWTVADGAGAARLFDEDDLAGFAQLRPIARFGYSICAFMLPENSLGITSTIDQM